MLPDIFCPKCSELVLDQPACLACGWQRPAATEGVGETAWAADLGTRLIKPCCYPVIAAGHYCLATEDGTLLALDLDSGQVGWERQLDADCTAHGLATDGERLFVGCEDKQPIPSPGKDLLALDARTGREVWQYTTNAHSLSAAAVGEGIAYVTAANGFLHAVDAGTGERLWAVEHPAWAPAAPAVGEGLVCAGGRGKVLVAYDAESGDERWRFSGEGWFATRPCMGAGRACASCWDGHLYVLEAHTGRRLAKVQTERGREFTAPPVMAGERVFIGSRVYREEGGKKKETYAMLALDVQDGREEWRFHTRRHIFAPATEADGVLFFGANDGSTYALDAARGEVQWRLELESRAVTEPLVAGNRVYFGRRDGWVQSVRWRAEPDEELLLPEAYEAQGRFTEAAVALAQKGDYQAAAVLYEKKLGRRREAAHLYERAGRVGQAATLWEGLGELRRARDLYRRAEDRPSLARVLEGQGEVLGAAQLQEEMGNRLEAAVLYERSGDRVRAAELFSQAGQSDRARRLWESLGEWERLAQDLIGEGKPAEAAAILEEHDRWERAADLYDEAGQPGEALRLRVKLEHWDRAAALASQVGDHAQEAKALEEAGRRSAAAEAYQRAAEQVAAAKPLDRDQAAALYEQAARLYAALFEEEEAVACRRQVQRYRRLPEVTVRVQAENVFVEYEWNTFNLCVENSGFGTACEIAIDLRGSFDIKGDTCVAGLRPKRHKDLEVFVRPHKDHYGPKVPLEIAVAHEDQQGGLYKGGELASVWVVQPGILPGSTTPLNISIEGDLMQPGSKKQVGDRVDIRRSSGGEQVLEIGATGNHVSVRRDGPPVQRCPSCNLPVQEADHHFCPDCGAPLAGDCE